MARPKAVHLTLAEQLARLRKSGISKALPAGMVPDPEDAADPLPPLPDRIRTLLGIFRHRKANATEMNYLIMYDITDNKVRKLVAKYLKTQGCIRIQKSVFMASTSHPKFNQIHATLKEVNEYYENEDSIMLVPVNVADVRSMKLIGKNVNIDILTDPPNTLFF
jgi:CRISPR-associated protein Cas2